MFSIATGIESLSSQVLALSLFHVTSVATRGKHGVRQHKNHSSVNNRSQKEKEDILFLDSFNAAVKSVSELIDSGYLSPVVIHYIKPPHVTRPKLPWVVSHKSGWNFDENRLLSLHSSSSKNYITISKRGFQTKRFPSVGLGSEPVNRGSLDILNDPHQVTSQQTEAKFKLGKLSGDTTEITSENVRALLSESSPLSPAEKQSIKVAFAEGYLAAAKTGSKSSRNFSKLGVFSVLKDVLGIVLIAVILFSFMGDVSGGPFRRVLIGSGNEVHPEEIDVSFSDVKGVDEAKQELQEVVEFLKNPDKFSALGGKLPKGVLLVGPPGTGKTLLARAVAGEAGVPFFHAAGPEFDEILVGQGARRVRDLFSTAKLRAPCVIFIDEIDSVGAKRTNSVIHPYANQTINQLLTEMDGFRQNEGVVVLGATNRRDDLDKALLRPGRFDVEVQVPVPDLKGRIEIFKLYLSRIILSPDVSAEVLAKRTIGFTGADIENMVNQAALRAAIDGSTSVTMKDLENSMDKVMMGPERKSRIPDEDEIRCTAFHESGHTLVAYYTRDAHPLHKVTIVSRGNTGGHTAFIPKESSLYNMAKSELMAHMDVSMGGRAAEELMFGDDKVTTGASNDLKTATSLATSMVKVYGMGSERVGLRTFDEDNRGLVVVNELASSTSEAIDHEIKKLLQDSYDRAKAVLKSHQKELKALAEALLKYETLDADQVKMVIEGKDPKDLRKR